MIHTNQRVPAISLGFSIERDMNRSQWYDLHCEFSSEGVPALVNQQVMISPNVCFQDSRKKPFEQPIVDKLLLSVSGWCSSTGKKLIKCPKCKEGDRSTTNRKRKRDSPDTWSEIDQMNNSILFQLMNGDYKINNKGMLDVRFRVMCCIGAKRQLHENHLGMPIHKGCEGFTLQVDITRNGQSVCSAITKDPIRAVGKVNKTPKVERGSKTQGGASEFQPQFSRFLRDEADDFDYAPPLYNSTRVESPLPPNDMFAFQQQQYKNHNNTNTPIVQTNISSTHEHTIQNSTYTKNIPYINTMIEEPIDYSSEDGYDDTEEEIPYLPNYNINQSTQFNIQIRSYRKEMIIILKEVTNYPISLHNVALLHKKNEKFPMVFQEIYDHNFFEESNLLNINVYSLLHTCNVISIGLMLSRCPWVVKPMYRLSFIGVKLAYQLVKIDTSKIISHDLLSLADGITRTAIIQGARGNMKTAVFFLNRALSYYGMLKNIPDISQCPFYKNGKDLLLFYRACYLPKTSSIKQAEQQLEYPFFKPYIIFLMMVEKLFPNFIAGKIMFDKPYPISYWDKEFSLLSSRLMETIANSGIRQTGDEKYGLICDKAYNAMWHLLNHDRDSAIEEIVSAAMLTSIIGPALQDPLPIQWSLLVSTQILGFIIFLDSCGNDNYIKKVQCCVEVFLTSFSTLSAQFPQGKVVDEFIRSILRKWLQEVGFNLGVPAY